MNAATDNAPQKYFVNAVRISGLWGVKDVHLRFDRKINFLIGPNGTGKTTVIRLLSGILRGDFREVIDVEFSKISVELRNVDQNASDAYTVAIEKKAAGKKGPGSLSVQVNKWGGSRPIISEEIQSVADVGLMSLWQLSVPTAESPHMPLGSQRLRDFLSKVCYITWLSIHRADPKAKAYGDRSHDSAVEKHLADLQHRFRAYISEHNAMAKKQVKEFEKNIFLSLTGGSGFPKITPDFASNISVPKYRDVIKHVLSSLEIPHEHYERNFDEFFRKAEISLAKLKGDPADDVLNMEDFFALSSLFQAERIADYWVAYQAEIEAINERKNAFLKILNDYLDPKKSYVGDDGSLMFYRIWAGLKDRRGDSRPNFSVFSPDELSSGEKQMVIFLMETLLQDARPHIFIADEPELSLHVTWQEKLIRSIIALNPAAQIIFATHSPDIVSEFDSYIIDMKEAV